MTGGAGGSIRYVLSALSIRCVLSALNPSRKPTHLHAQPARVQHDDIALLERLAQARGDLVSQVGRRIVGQRDVLDGILTAILSGGHALLVGVPGLAKTLMVSTMVPRDRVTRSTRLSFPVIRQNGPRSTPLSFPVST